MDLAPSQPARVRELLTEWDKYMADNAVLNLARPPSAKRDDASL